MAGRIGKGAAVVGIALAVNVAAARLDASSDDSRRESAERDLRARLARLHVRDARVTCSDGLTCTVRMRDGRAAQLDPRIADLSRALASAG